MFLSYKDLTYIHKISRRIQILFYRPLQEFEYIYYYFLMTQIGTNFRYVFRLHRSDLHAKISHRIHHINFYRPLQKYEDINIYCSFLMTQIGTKYITKCEDNFKIMSCILVRILITLCF